MKIIGNTVGMGLPKPNLMQTDPTKGDYVKGKSEFLKLVGGGTGSLLVVTFTDENGTLTPSHTYDQIKAWADNGGYAVLTDGNTWYPLFASKSIIRFERVVITASESMLIQYLITPFGEMDKLESHYDHTTGGGGLDATIDGETLVFAESSTATIENETLIL